MEAAAQLSAGPARPAGELSWVAGQAADQLEGPWGRGKTSRRTGTVCGWRRGLLPDGLIKSLKRGTQLQGSNKYAFHVLDSYHHTLCWVAQKYSSLIPITDTGREYYRCRPVLQLGKQRLES